MDDVDENIDNAISMTFLTSIYDKSVKEYIKSRKKKLPEFVSEFFSFKGAFQINKKALSLDMIKVPFNIVWMLCNLIIKLVSIIIRKLGFGTLSSKMNKIPKGFVTNVIMYPKNWTTS